MSFRQNSIATPFTEIAFKIHDYAFNALYPCPLHIKVENGIASIKVDNIFQLKYVPYLLIFLFVTILIYPGSCLFLLLLKFFQPNATNAGVVVLVLCISFASALLYQVGNVVLYYNCP